MAELLVNLDALPDDATRAAVRHLLNLVEQLVAENRALREENQRLWDEIHRLNGEQGKPQILPNRPAKASGAAAPADFSSEAERRTPKPWTKQPKRDRIVIHRTRICRLDRSLLPHDAEFKGYEDVVVQDLILRCVNTRFRKEVFYSPSTGRRYAAVLPPGYTGSYGPTVHALALSLAYGRHVSHAQIHTFFTEVGLLISTGEVAHLLTQGHGRFHAEKQHLLRAGLGASPWQQLDVTPTRVNGHNEAGHILCNPRYTFYQTLPTQERLSALRVLQGGGPLAYRLDERAWAYLAAAGVSQKLRRAVAQAAGGSGVRDWEEAEFEAWLESSLGGAGPQQRQRLREAAALAAYEAQAVLPKVALLVCDDAPQFRGLTREVALCWIHEGRHYKKLAPYLGEHQRLLEAFRKEFWAYYRKLLAYQAQPSPEAAARLASEFDTLFATRTGYGLLDERIAKTAAKKAELLAVLAHPEVPLHNNASELGARQRVRKRDVSFGPRSAAGREAWDTFQTLAATAAKLGISFYEWVHDRLSGANRLPSLAEVIEERGRLLNLGASWETR